MNQSKNSIRIVWREKKTVEWRQSVRNVLKPKEEERRKNVIFPGPKQASQRSAMNHHEENRVGTQKKAILSEP